MHVKQGDLDTIPHPELMAGVKRRVADGRVLKLLEAYVSQGVMDGLEQWTPEAGTPQGAVISPLLAKLYLHPVDQALGLNPVLRGWFEYYKHSRSFTFTMLDGWIRMRLRSLLRKRHGRRGRGRGSDHQRWTDAFFRAQDLYSLVEAHRRASQSP